jgi:hypothetical protein
MESVNVSFDFLVRKQTLENQSKFLVKAKSRYWKHRRPEDATKNEKVKRSN